jgi:hypothetical protein
VPGVQERGEEEVKNISICGGTYPGWMTPKQLLEIDGEPIVARTIRLLRENGVEDIAISSNDEAFEQFGVPVLHHENTFVGRAYNDYDGYWCEAFYPTSDPACYIFGDVVFSPEAIKKIVETETDSIEFFASAPPFNRRYRKKSAETFALKVENQGLLHYGVEMCIYLDRLGCFKRKPIMWELWQVIKGTPLNIIDYTNYVVINDYTCDIDGKGDLAYFQGVKR